MMCNAPVMSEKIFWLVELLVVGLMQMSSRSSIQRTAELCEFSLLKNCNEEKTENSAHVHIMVIRVQIILRSTCR